MCANLYTKTVESQKLDISKLGYSWQHFDLYPQFNFVGRKRVLFLSDNGKSGHLSKLDSGTLFVSTDISNKTGIDLRMDNNYLPFTPGSFDVVIMNRGLCACHSAAKACGGMALEPAAIHQFLQNISQSLNSKNPNSIALLTGFYFLGNLGATVPGMFVSQFAQLRINFPELEYTFLSDPTLEQKDGFIGIAIHSKKSSLVGNLRQLIPR